MFATPGPAQDEPTYGGKPLGYWVWRLQKAEKKEEQSAASQAIIGFGPDAAPAVPALVKMLDDRSEKFRETVGQILCDLGPAARSAVPDLVRSLKDGKARSPEVVIRILGKIGPDARDAVPLLTNLLKEKKLAIEAVDALGEIGLAAQSALPAIRQALRDREPEAATFLGAAVQTLGKIGPKAVPVLIELLQEDGIDSSNRAAIAASLGQYGSAAKSAVPVLTLLIEKDSVKPGDRADIAKVLGQIGSAARKAVPSLVRVLKSQSAALRVSAATALWKIEKHPLAIPSLIQQIKDVEGKDGFYEETVQASRAADALGEIGAQAKTALPTLQQALSSKCGWVRSSAVDAIRKIDSERGRKIKVDSEGKVH